MTDSFEEKIERKMDEWREIAKKRAKAKAEVVYLEQFRKAKLAILASQAPDGAVHMQSTPRGPRSRMPRRTCGDC